MENVALITGASSGIGEALTEEFSVHGYDLVIVARSASRLQSLAERLGREHGTKVCIVAKDLSVETSPEEIFQEVHARQLKVDIVVNCAGLGDYGSFHRSNWEKSRRMIAVNIIALTKLTHLFLPGMVERRRGRILNIASTAAFQPGPLMSVYYASKAYVLHFSEAIANELEGTGVSVTVFCPGPVSTNFQSVAAMQESRLVKNRSLPTAAEVARDAFRAMEADEVVRVHGRVNYLLSLTSRFVPRSVVRRVARYIQDRRG